MTTTIVGLFDEERSVQLLKQEIRSRGIDDNQIETLSWNSLSAGNDPWGINRGGSKSDDVGANLAAHLRDCGVADDDARDFAEAVRRGGNLVLTRVDDDQQVDEITRLMDDKEAIDLDDRRAMWRNADGRDRDEGASLRESEETLQAGDQARVQEAHEELKIGKRKVATGGVRVHKHVEETPVDENVTLREEHIDIERRPINASDRSMAGEDAFKDETIEFTEHGEEPVVEKEIRLDDEYVATRNVEERTENIQDTVRETVVDIEPLTQGLDSEQRFDTLEPTFQEHYRANYADSGDFNDYRSAYRYGHAFGSNEKYNQRNYEDIEPELKRSYEAKHGEGTFGRFGNAARHAYDSMRNRRRT